MKKRSAKRIVLWIVLAVCFVSALRYIGYLRNRPKADYPHFTVAVTPDSWTPYTLRNKSRFTFKSDDPDAQFCFVVLKGGDCDSPYYVRETVDLGNQMPRQIFFKGTKPVRIYYSPLPASAL